jgi:MFS family permease
VLALLAVKAGFGIAAGVLVLIAVFARSEYRSGEVGIGILMAARGVGALIGPFVGRRLAGPEDRRLFAAIGIALAVFGIGYTALGFMPSLLLAAPTIAVAHLGGGAQWTLSSYGIQRVVPDRIRGRIFAFDAALITLTLTVSALITGWTAETYGARPTATVLGLVAIAWAGTWTWLTTDVRRATMIDGCGPAPDLDLSAEPAG